MKITKFAQSTFIIENNAGYRVLIDPGNLNYENGFTPEDFGKIDILFITHKHDDHHWLEAERIIVDKSNPAVFTNSEISQREYAKELGYICKSVGEEIHMYGFDITLIHADHCVQGEQINNFGLFICADGKSFYHTSDTRFMGTSCYKHDLVKHCDILAVPISNRGVVMGIDDSIVFTSQIKPRYVIPMHYDGHLDKGRVWIGDFMNRYKQLTQRIEALEDTTLKVLIFSETIDLI